MPSDVTVGAAPLPFIVQSQTFWVVGSSHNTIAWPCPSDAPTVPCTPAPTEPSTSDVPSALIADTAPLALTDRIWPPSAVAVTAAPFDVATLTRSPPAPALKP